MRPLDSWRLFINGLPIHGRVTEVRRCDCCRRSSAYLVFLAYDNGRTRLNFLAPTQTATQAFSPGTLERLRTVKRNRDPHGVFRGNYPVLGWGLIRATS